MSAYLAERAELESDTLLGTTRLAGGPRTSRVHAPYMVIRAGLEPSISALKGLCPNHLDERTILRRRDPARLVCNENIIDAHMKRRRKDN